MLEIISIALMGLAVDLLKSIPKKAVNGIKDLFSEDELIAVLKQAFIDFRESCIENGGKKEDKVLLAPFFTFVVTRMNLTLQCAIIP